MRSLVFTGLALALTMVPVAANAQGAPQTVRTQTLRHGGTSHVTTRHWGPRQNGRWVAGWRAPGGWNSYRPVVRGYVLPSYWVNPSFFIGNYARYGFTAPSAGYGWSRYYDDAVLTDRDGRVHDTVRGVDWDRYDAYDEGEDYSDSYGYRDDRRQLPYEFDDRGERDDVTYQGRWTGTWTGQYEGDVYKGTYDGRYDGSAPHWGLRGRVQHGGPAYGYGYGWGAPMITTITFQSAPIVMTTTTTTEEVTYAAAPRKRVARRVWKPRPKARCVC